MGQTGPRGAVTCPEAYPDRTKLAGLLLGALALLAVTAFPGVPGLLPPSPWHSTECCYYRRPDYGTSLIAAIMVPVWGYAAAYAALRLPAPRPAPLVDGRGTMASPVGPIRWGEVEEISGWEDMGPPRGRWVLVVIPGESVAYRQGLLAAAHVRWNRSATGYPVAIHGGVLPETVGELLRRVEGLLEEENISPRPRVVPEALREDGRAGRQRGPRLFGGRRVVAARRAGPQSAERPSAWSPFPSVLPSRGGGAPARRHGRARGSRQGVSRWIG